jgi:hypothetical protein
MPEDGDAMYVHDQERHEALRRPAESLRAEHDAAWQGARRAAEAGHIRGVEPAAVLHLQRLSGNASVGALVDGEAEERRSPVLDVIGKGGGAPLRSDVRGQMEAGLGADFGDVRVHAGGAAAESAHAVSAKAYTVGNEVVFGQGAYQPDTADGRHTLAHELTHVVQQRSGPVDGTSTGDGVALSHPDDRFEREAESTAAAVGRGETAQVSAAPASVQRQADEEEEPAQTVREDAAVQREGEEEEESAQTMREDAAVQREGEEEEESAQTMREDAAVQREGEEEEEAPA